MGTPDCPARGREAAAPHTTCVSQSAPAASSRLPHIPSSRWSETWSEAAAAGGLSLAFKQTQLCRALWGPRAKGVQLRKPRERVSHLWGGDTEWGPCVIWWAPALRTPRIPQDPLLTGSLHLCLFYAMWHPHQSLFHLEKMPLLCKQPWHVCH